MSGPAIELSGLQKRFGERVALRAVDLRVEEGELVGFVGPNGAGKTTCMRILVGLMFADDGSASVLGMDPARQSLEIRKRCCYLPGETSIYQQMTGAEFLAFALSFYKQQSDIARELHEIFPLPLKQKVRSYSSGMKQKLAILASLIPDVSLHVLDEPDRALDANSRLDLRGILKTLQRRGKSILLSSHQLSEVEALADRTVFLVAGRSVDEEHVRAARDSLRKAVRIRLDGDLELPSGTAKVTHQSDGSIHITTTGNPLDWLAQLPSEKVLTAEVGATRLEDLYSLLTHYVETGEN